MDQIQYYEQKLAFETDSWDLNELLHRDEVTVVDTRGADAFKHEHIPGAVNLPHREMSLRTTADLPRDRLYVTYCDGIGCNASTKGALNLLRLGFTVKELLGGLDWWKRDGYPTEGMQGLEGDPASCGC